MPSRDRASTPTQLHRNSARGGFSRFIPVHTESQSPEQESKSRDSLQHREHPSCVAGPPPRVYGAAAPNSFGGGGNVVIRIRRTDGTNVTPTAEMMLITPHSTSAWVVPMAVANGPISA